MRNEMPPGCSGWGRVRVERQLKELKGGWL